MKGLRVEILYLRCDLWPISWYGCVLWLPRMNIHTTKEKLDLDKLHRVGVLHKLHHLRTLWAKGIHEKLIKGRELNMVMVTIPQTRSDHKVWRDPFQMVTKISSTEKISFFELFPWSCVFVAWTNKRKSIADQTFMNIKNVGKTILKSLSSKLQFNVPKLFIFITNFNLQLAV